MPNPAHGEQMRLEDIPVVVLSDRRKAPDRRTPWRGGRRDSDWVSRPLGALARFARRRQGKTKLWFFSV